MRRLAMVAVFLASMGAGAETPWRQLFNGVDTDGWEHVGPGFFTVEKGLLKTHGGMGLLWYTRERFGNAVIRVVFHADSPSGNSGVYIRIQDKPRDPWYAVHFGYEVQIEDAGDEFHRTGVIYSLSKAMAKAPPGPDGWNTMEIALDGQRTVVTVNGVKVTDFRGTDPVPPRKMWYEPERGPRADFGYIGLQNHDDRSTIEFREVSVRPLDGAGLHAAATGFHDWSKVAVEKLPEGSSRQILYGQNIMMVRVSFPPSFGPPAHKHPHEQWTLVEKGPITFRVGEQERSLQTGAVVYIPGGVMHGARSGAGGAVLVDVFTPIREGFLK